MTDFVLTKCPACLTYHAAGDCPIARGARRGELTGERRAEPPRRSVFHDKLPACPVCKVPAREACIDAQGRTFPGTAVHRARVTPHA